MLIIGLFRKADTYTSLTVFFFFIEKVWNNIHLMHLFIVHPRRPRGSQSGREKRQDENFQVRAKEPLGTDSYRTISKNSSGCRLLIGHKKCFVLLCPIGEQFVLSSWVPTRRLLSLAHAPKKCTQSANFQFDIKSPSDFKILSARNSHFFSLYSDYSNLLTLPNASEPLWSWNSINHIQVHEENEFCHCLFTSMTKREIRHFHG